MSPAESSRLMLVEIVAFDTLRRSEMAERVVARDEMISCRIARSVSFRRDGGAARLPPSLWSAEPRGTASWIPLTGATLPGGTS
jgi:hypothetical protein